MPTTTAARLALLTASLPLAGLGLADARASMPDDDHPAEVRLIAATDSIVPGETLELGLTFDIRDGWYTYWVGDSDTGIPPIIEMKLPDGFEAKDAKWPAPQRQVGGTDDLLDYVHKEQLTIILPVKVPSDLSPGDEVTFSMDAEWLVCEAACIPGWGEFELTLPVAASPEDAKPSEHAARFEKTRQRLPSPLPEQASEQRWPVVMELDGNTLRITSPSAERITVYLGPQARRPVDAIENGTAEGGELQMRFMEREADKPVRGVVEVTRPGDRDPLLYSFELPRPDGEAQQATH